MASRRKNDSPDGRTYFRSDRIVRDGGKWYFMTRERTVEGPFESRLDAVQRLETYIRLAEMDLLDQPSIGGRHKALAR